MFLSTTQFHGFLYTGDEGKKTKFFWLALTLLSAAMCVNDFVHLVSVYFGEPTNININIKSNEEITFKTPTLCMEIFQTIDTPQHCCDWGKIEQLTTEIDKVINMTERYDMPANIDHSVLTYTYLMLGIITKAELHQTGQSIDKADILAAIWASPPDIGSTLSWLFQYYTNKQVSFNALKRVIAAAICRQHFTQFLRYQHPADPQPQILPLCKPDMITYMGYSLICTKMFQSDTVPINSSTQYKTFAIAKTNQYTGISQWARFDATLINHETDSFHMSNVGAKLVWYVDFEGRPSLHVASRTNIFSWNPNTFLKVDVAVDRRVQMYNRNVQKCSEANDQYSCEWQKRAERMAESCSCWPSTLMHISKGVETNWPDCYTTISPTTILTDNFAYPQCGQNLSYLNGVENLCLPNCLRVSYGATKHNLGSILDTINIYDDYSFEGYFEVQFQFGGNCLEIIESPTTSWSSFIWTFGGSMGTWLGGSVLALVHILFYLLKKLNQLWQRRKNIPSVQPAQIDMYGRSKRY